MKKKLFALIAVLAILTGVVAGTAAYFTASEQTHNVITSGNIDIALVETMIDENDTDEDGVTTDEVPYHTNPVDGIVPGLEVSKIVRVHNVGANPAWVRIRVDVSVKDEENADMGTDNLQINFHTEQDDEWLYEDGYYYYKEVLNPGSATEQPLFDAVKFLESMDNDYWNANISISVKAEGIQYENNLIPDGETVTSVWPEGIDILAFPFVGE